MRNILILLICLPMIGFGQGWNLLLDHPYANTNENAYSFVEDNDGYLIVGTKTGYPFENKSDIWLIKVDFNGDTVYTKSINITNNDVAYSIEKTNDGGYILGATVESNYPIGSSYFNESFCLIKLNSFGDTTWKKHYNNPWGTNPVQSTVDICYSAIQTSDGGYMMAGKGRTVSIGALGALVLKTDQFGNIIWSKLYTGMDIGTLSISSQSQSYKSLQIIETSDSNYMMVVASGGNNGNPISALVKINSIGDTLWVKSFLYYTPIIGNQIVTTDDGGYVLCGEKYNVFSGDDELYYFKTNSDGDLIWEEYHFNDMSNYTNNSLYDDAFTLNSVNKTSDDGFVFCSIDYDQFGTQGFRFPWYIFKTDSLGNVIFSNRISLPNPQNSGWTPSSIKQTNDNGYLIIGYNDESGMNSNFDIVIVKTDSQGNVTSTKEIPLYNPNRKLEKVVDILGRDIKPQTNTPFIEIYDDGTLEKRIVIE